MHSLLRNSNRLCPFCLSLVRFEKTDGLLAQTETGVTIESRQRFARYRCPDATCGRIIPRMYVEDYDKFPPVVISAVGFRTHGKTVHFASTLAAFDNDDLSGEWPRFYTLPLNRTAIKRIHELACALRDEGRLPEPSQSVFPEPTMIRIKGTPLRFPCTLLMFDTSGEAFKDHGNMGEYARFVRRAETAQFFIRIKDLRKPDVAHRMKSLLQTYIVGMREMGADTQQQNMVVTFTAADEIVGQLPGCWQKIADYVNDGDLAHLGSRDYAEQMADISDELWSFTEHELKATPFTNTATNNFREIRFSMVSALGSRPVDVDGSGTLRLEGELRPLRILDPLLWAMDLSRQRIGLSRNGT